MEKITGIEKIVLSGDVADYGNDTTLETIESYRNYLYENTDCEDIEISYNSNIDNWEFNDEIDEREQKEIINELWNKFCNENKLKERGN